MTNKVKKEIKELIKKDKLNCSVEEFIRSVDFYSLSIRWALSEDFIREFKDKVSWHNNSAWQKMSESFIREFQDKVNWN